ncbi:hypothetical protein A2344_03445 [Candidatus Peregrinibacteria bacterium RIFOXYB12_FULL_41_12]|nr:MAG: hypothetical protein A2244_03605 [Candidatus Peregrinibacteria bacterium RIFOXYA2_FULL_41_18]OGJ49803.1 MAG: hypothetical protein A2344_03445 [Candidatus Peregrinibacteria bacterium RIFOXYB12_FULL_41_12]OGJ53096.1 MAG: hypothetical protein A2336_05370 [Candidatus Peregrinibacteria bacterium RIFOXYB2_FULL_41_88]
MSKKILVGVLVAMLFFSSCERESVDEAWIIDTHFHLDGDGLQNNFDDAAEYAVSLFEEFNIKSVLLMPPPQTEGQKMSYDYDELLPIVEAYPEYFKLVAGGGSLSRLINEAYNDGEVTDDMRDEFEETAQEIVDAGAVAFGEMASLHLSFRDTHPFEYAPPNHELFLLLADISAENDMPIDWHMEAVSEDQSPRSFFNEISSNNPDVLYANIAEFEELLDYNLDAKIVWQHIGWDNTGDMTSDLIRRLLADHSNLYLSLRVEDPEYSKSVVENRLVDDDGFIRDEWLQLISDYPDRFMIGTDEFVYNPSTGVDKIGPPSFQLTVEFLDQLPEDLAYQVGYANAARVYGLE